MVGITRTTGKVLIVGAGLAGSVYARSLADAGYQVLVIDQRPHIAGNCFDHVDEHGHRVHKYGPHLFHTSNPVVMAWCRRFSEWAPYELRVRALTEKGPVPLPINFETLERLFEVKLSTKEEAGAFLSSLGVGSGNPKNAAEHLYKTVGVELTELFFRPYSEKMWGIRLEQLDASVVKRIPLNLSHDNRYFPNELYQFLPRDGYLRFFENMLSHPRIEIAVSTPFSGKGAAGTDHVFYSGSLDEYFGYSCGVLPYRSIRFHHKYSKRSDITKWGITNFTDTGPYTRRISWCSLPLHDAGGAIASFTLEEPCDFLDNDKQRYYPIKSATGEIQRMLARYRALASEEKHTSFIGRCGTYQYLDMHQVINQSLAGARRWIEERR